MRRLLSLQPRSRAPRPLVPAASPRHPAWRAWPQMFVADPPYDKSSEQLAAFLGALVVEEKLTLQGGLYRKQAQ